MASKQWS